MAAAHPAAEEPSLTISRRPRFWWSPFGAAFVVAVCVMLVGLLLIAARPPGAAVEPVVTVTGIMASKQDFFNDEEVRRLLRGHRIEVAVTARGSREVAYDVINQKTERYDFAFPSGQPAADLIKNHRRENGRYVAARGLFSSPVVLASYRGYAETLARAGVAEPQGGEQDPLYYTLDLERFVKLGEDGATWNSIGIDEYDDGETIRNGNRVLAHVPGVCRANSAATYLGLVAFVKNGYAPPRTEAEVDTLAPRLQPLITGIGMPEENLFRSYVTPEGKSEGPVVVVYEHQYLEYQLNRQRQTGGPDLDRVLLYPKQEFLADPEFISLKPGPADRLAELLATDSALRTRMKELGYRVIDDTDTVGSRQLFRYLAEHGLPVPTRAEATRALLPELDLLEMLIRRTGRCPR